MTDELYTRTLILRPASPEELKEMMTEQQDPREIAHLERIYQICAAHPQDAHWHTLWKIFKKKSGEEVGMVQFCGLPKNGRVEVNCALSPVKDSDKLAVQALKRMAKWAFSRQKDLYFVSTWLADDDSPAAQILENAGFGQTFEADGMVHYEMARPRVSLLMLTMLLFTVLSFIPGYFLDSYPLFVTIGIVAGIFPGHILETKVERFRAKRSRRHQRDPLKQ